MPGAFRVFGYGTMPGEAIFMIMMGGLNIFIGPIAGASLLRLFNDVITRNIEDQGLTLGIVVLLFALRFKRGITDIAAQHYSTINNKGDTR